MRDPRRRIAHAYETLLAVYGPQAWWPSEGPFETMVGAVLTQHASWRNAERAIEALRARGLLRPAAIAFGSALPRDAATYGECHALIVRLGKERCRPLPVCSGCPLEADLEARGRACRPGAPRRGTRPRRRGTAPERRLEGPVRRPA
jgi:endonuclease-3 related protein